MIAWSDEQPERIGEVAHFVGGAPLRVLGRGPAERDSEAVDFYRQRPDELVPGPPIEGPGISRRQLAVRARDGALLIERIGRCPVLVRGENVERTAVLPGDTIHLKGQLLLLCVTRPLVWPALRNYSRDAWARFGLADAIGIVGESAAAWALRESLAFAAQARGHVLVTGPSGTGKELAARAIHTLSSRARKRFVARNAATFPNELVDAELFGNAKGYPNPGFPERPGLIGEAGGGTLFLDEVGDLPERLQSHLLRVLDRGGEYQRLGDSASLRADLRVVGATNRDTSSLRADLLARFGVRIALPALSERRDDVPLLVRHVLDRAAAESPSLLARFQEKSGAFRIAPELVEHLVLRESSANVREIEELVWRAIETSRGDRLRLTDALRAPLESAPSATDAVAPGGAREPSADEIRAIIQRHDGNLSRAARELGLSNRFAIYRLLKKAGIDLGSLRS